MTSVAAGHSNTPQPHLRPHGPSRPLKTGLASPPVPCAPLRGQLRPALTAINEVPDTMANSISLDQFSHQGSGSCPQLIGPPPPHPPGSEHVLESEGLSRASATPTVIDTDNRIAGKRRASRGEVRGGSPACVPKVRPLLLVAHPPHLNLPLH